MKTLIKNISSLVTLKEGNPDFRVGKEMQNISEIKDGAIFFDEKVIWSGTTAEAELKLKNKEIQPDEILDFTGKTIMPGFVDSHTHLVFGGNRTADFAKKLQGYTYREIAAEGGGILNTVNGTRTETHEELCAKAEKLAWEAIAHGTTTMEIKSGYGLSTESEIKLLEVIQMLKDRLPIHIVPTFLGAHDFPPEYADNHEAYVDIIINDMLPKVAERGLAQFCDAFIEEGFYSVEQGRRIFSKAKELGFDIKVHAEQLSCQEGASLAAEFGAFSADHLLYTSDEGVQAMAKSGTVATMLPGADYFIRMPFTPARKFIDNGVITAVASNCNPGSCPSQNMQIMMTFCTISMQMTVEETLTAATLNGAKALGLSSTKGSLADGKDADFIVIDSPTYVEMFYRFGINHVKQVWIGGKKINY